MQLARLWGQVRPGFAQQVTLEERARGSDAWLPVAQVATDDHGYWTADYPVDRRADYRISWVEPPLLITSKPLLRTSGVLDIDAGRGRLRTSTGA
jgi:hypothetical protein